MQTERSKQPSLENRQTTVGPPIIVHQTPLLVLSTEETKEKKTKEDDEEVEELSNEELEKLLRKATMDEPPSSPIHTTNMATKILEYESRNRLAEHICDFCKMAFTTNAITFMGCGKHKFHNSCAHSFLYSSITATCIFCHPRVNNQSVFLGKSTDNFQNMASSIQRNPFNLGDDIFQSSNAEARSLLFQNLKEYKSEFNVNAIRHMLINSDDPSSSSTSDNMSSPKNAAVGTLVSTVWDLFREGMDFDIVKKQEEGALLIHHGDPSSMIQKGVLKVDQLKRNGVNATNLLCFKVSIERFFEGGYTIEDIAVLGITRTQLLALGFDSAVWKTFHNRISVNQLVLFYDFTIDFVFNNVCGQKMSNFVKLSLTFEDLVALKTKFNSLVARGLTWKNFKQLRISPSQGKAIGLEIDHLLQWKVSKDEFQISFPEIEDSSFRRTFGMDMSKLLFQK